MDEVAPSFASDEAAVFWRYLSSSLDRLVELTTAVDPGALGWRPQTPAGANSLAGLATHTLGNAEENILGVLAGRPVDRDHEREFAAVPSQAAIADRWRHLRPRLLAVLSRLSAEEVARPRAHPRRGTITAREVLLVVARHAAEHLGQAELTRDLWLAAQTRHDG
jgi:uncharacterized damage-inducible protein DinB